jgi:CheY-like chemotaxis protein
MVVAFENHTALVVDDDPNIVEVTKLALQSVGIKNVTFASDGLEAKGIVQSADAPFDIVICDWMMPKLDGPGFLSFFRENNRDTPFIMLTGKSSESDFSSISNNPKDYFLTKQGSLNDIMDTISKALKS